MNLRLGMLSAAGLLCLAGQTICAQTTPSTYAAIFCVKVTPGKNAEYERMIADVSHKLAQVAISEKRMTRWSVSRAVVPSGEQARCSYVLGYFYQGPPPAPSPTTDADLKKAGVNMTAQAMYDKRNAISKLVESQIAVRYAGFGASQKGDYWQMNHMKPKPGKGQEFRNFERTRWLPLAEEAAKSGHPRKAWAGYYIIYPSGTGAPYDDVTVDVFRDWASIWKPQGYSKETIAKVFPGKSSDDIFGPLGGLRDLTRRELYVVVDVLQAAQ